MPVGSCGWLAHCVMLLANSCANLPERCQVQGLATYRSVHDLTVLNSCIFRSQLCRMMSTVSSSGTANFYQEPPPQSPDPEGFCSKRWGFMFWGPHKEDYSILGSILESFYLWELPFRIGDPQTYAISPAHYLKA